MSSSSTNIIFYIDFGVIFLDVLLRLVLIEKRIVAKLRSTTDLEEKYWIGIYKLMELPCIKPLSKMLSIFALGLLECLEVMIDS